MVLSRKETTTAAPTALWVVPVADLGGVARHVLDVARAGLPGWRLVVLCPEGALAARLRDTGAAVVTGPFGPGAGFRASLRTLQRTLRSLRPAVVHSHLSYADVVSACALVGDWCTRLVTTEHGIAADDMVYHGSAAKSRLKAAMHAVRLRRADGIVAVSEATRAAMVAKWRPSKPVTVIPNGVDRAEGGRVGLSNEAALEGPRVLSLSRLSPEKRLPDLLNAFAKLHTDFPAATLTVAGEGPLRGELQELTKQLGIEQAVGFPGFLDAREAMAAADVLVQLSVWENCSYTLLDAVNAGLGVVATPVGGNPEILPERCLVEAGDVDGIVEAVKRQSFDVEQRPGLPEEWPTVPGMARLIVDEYPKVTDSPTTFKGVAIAANNGDIGGGEVMLLSLAREIRELGIPVRVIGPKSPSGLVDAARAAGHSTIVLPAFNRLTYMIALRRWHRQHRDELLWCNGLAPSTATAGRPGRVVHLHQLPRGGHVLLAMAARWRSGAVLVPSRYMAGRIGGAQVLQNWVDEIPVTKRGRTDGIVRLGFLGRPSLDKGVGVLAEALHRLDQRSPNRYRLVLAGEPRFVDKKGQQALEQLLAPVQHLVERPGWMDRWDFFNLIDVMVCPSIAAESFGLVVAEAMSARVPFVISNAGALPEVAGAHHPWVAAAGDAVKLTEKIQSATEINQTETLDRAYQRWNSNFSSEAGRGRVKRLLTRPDLFPHYEQDS